MLAFNPIRALRKEPAVAGLLVCSVVSIVGCSGASNDQEETGTTSAAPTTSLSHSATVKESLTLGPDHVLQFVEFKPGIIGTVESGRIDVDKPVVTGDLLKLSWSELYTRLAGADAQIPDSIVNAELSKPEPSIISKAPETATDESHPGPTLYNAGEQSWFRNTFCNGANNCVQGFDWTVMYSHFNVNTGSAYAMVGSEGQTNATFASYYWGCIPATLFQGSQCYWVEFWHALVVPGHWLQENVNGNGNSIRWNLTGAGTNTQVSTAAHYN